MLVTQRGSSTSRSPQKRVALRVVCMKVGGNTLRHPCLGFADTLTHTKNVTINTCYQTWPLSLYQSFFFFFQNSPSIHRYCHTMKITSAFSPGSLFQPLEMFLIGCCVIVLHVTELQMNIFTADVIDSMTPSLLLE